jgi:uncharacterized protein YwgA
MSPVDLVYSNNACSAFLTAIVVSFEQSHPGGYLGRTAVQKLTYFAKVMGVPIPCSFGIYTYGPYSDTVTFVMESLIADDVVVDRSTKIEYSDYRLGPNATKLLDAYDCDIRPHVSTIERVVQAIGGFKPQELELVATLHFIAQRQRQIYRRQPTKPEVMSEFTGIKGAKFTPETISAWYDALKSAGLIQAKNCDWPIATAGQGSHA